MIRTDRIVSQQNASEYRQSALGEELDGAGGAIEYRQSAFEGEELDGDGGAIEYRQSAQGEELDGDEGKKRLEAMQGLMQLHWRLYFDREFYMTEEDWEIVAGLEEA
jgi:hypothetical protein